MNFRLNFRKYEVYMLGILSLALGHCQKDTKISGGAQTKPSPQAAQEKDEKDPLDIEIPPDLSELGESKSGWNGINISGTLRMAIIPME